MHTFFRIFITSLLLITCTLVHAHQVTKMDITLDNKTKKAIEIQLRDNRSGGGGWVHLGTFPLLDNVPMNLERKEITYSFQGRGLVLLMEADHKEIACQFDVFDDFVRDESGVHVYDPTIDGIAGNCAPNGYFVSTSAHPFELHIKVEKIH